MQQMGYKPIVETTTGGAMSARGQRFSTTLMDDDEQPLVPPNKLPILVASMFDSLSFKHGIILDEVQGGTYLKRSFSERRTRDSSRDAACDAVKR